MLNKVFLVDDQPEVIELLADLLAGHGKQTEGFADGDRALAALASSDQEVGLIILDLDLGPSKRSGLEILTDLKKAYPSLPVIILTGKGSVDDAVRAMRLGATDFIEKDPRMGERLGLQMEKLDRMIEVLEDNRRLQRQNDLLQARVGARIKMVGQDGGLAEVVKKIHLLAEIPRPVLILGERGTGKELVAAALHEASSRRHHAFVTVNCAAMPESLVEAELFGHEKGAFTDASTARPGKFELADSGTLFLDEVGNMPQAVQQKILRVIEYQRFQRVRGEKEISVDVRVTAATNANLDEEMSAGRFRSDLYDRLAFDTIEVPPLRQRREDIPALCRHFIESFKTEVAGVRCSDISTEALAHLSGQAFYGNVRELKNLIERAAYRCQSEILQDTDLQDASLAGQREPLPPAAEGGSLREQVSHFEKNLLAQALERSRNNMTQAAKSLGLGYDQMRRLVKKHELGR